jgi:hypothetical protein
MRCSKAGGTMASMGIFPGNVAQARPHDPIDAPDRPGIGLETDGCLDSAGHATLGAPHRLATRADRRWSGRIPWARMAPRAARDV